MKYLICKSPDRIENNLFFRVIRFGRGLHMRAHLRLSADGNVALIATALHCDY